MNEKDDLSKRIFSEFGQAGKNLLEDLLKQFNTGLRG